MVPMVGMMLPCVCWTSSCVGLRACLSSATYKSSVLMPCLFVSPDPYTKTATFAMTSLPFFIRDM